MGYHIIQYHGLKNGEEGLEQEVGKGGGLMYVYNVKVEVKSVPVAATPDRDERHARLPLLPEYESREVGRWGKGKKRELGKGRGERSDGSWRGKRRENIPPPRHQDSTGTAPAESFGPNAVREPKKKK